MNIVIWTKDNCTFCLQAKRLAEARGLKYEERKIGDGWTREQLLEAVPGARTVPQIFIDEQYVGGFAEMKAKLL